MNVHVSGSDGVMSINGIYIAFVLNFVNHLGLYMFVYCYH